MARETVRVSHQTWHIISRQNSTYTIYLHPSGSNSFPASICHFPVPTHVPVWNHNCPHKKVKKHWIPQVSWAKLALFFAGGKGGKSPWKDMNMHQNFLEGSVSVPKATTSTLTSCWRHESSSFFHIRTAERRSRFKIRHGQLFHILPHDK